MPRFWEAASLRCESILALAIESITPDGGEIVYLLLVGGAKSTQARDIQRAKTLLKSLPKE